MALFALDEGFPQTILEVGNLLPDVELRPLRQVDPGLVGNSEDWAILLRLFQDPEPFDGLITTDASMHNLPKEMTVLHQTNLTLVQVLAAGNDAIRATALVLLHLPYIAQETRSGRPQYWPLRPPPRRPAQRAVDALGVIGRNVKLSVEELIAAERLTDEQLRRDLWEWYEPTNLGY